jgi:hypothetical protein
MNSTRPIAASTIFHTAMPNIDAPANTKASTTATTTPLIILDMAGADLVARLKALNAPASGPS